jgi:hypothetical protein
MTSNGRVDLLTTHLNSTDQFKIYDKIPVHHPLSYQNPTIGLWINTPLSSAFFSATNIHDLQIQIQHGVYIKSNKQLVIALQDEDQLKIIMRSIYLQYSKHDNQSIEEQVLQLNQLVLSYCIPQVYGEALSYKKYLYDASTMYKPMDRPVLTKTNHKQLQMQPWF